MADHFAEAVLQLLTRQVTDVRFWQRLHSQSTIGATVASRAETIDDAGPAVVKAMATFRTSGYFAVKPVLSSNRLASITACVERLRDLGWPAVFAFVYDDPWLLIREAVVQKLVSIILGQGYRQIPHIWVHDVDPEPGRHGWKPHVDGEGEDRMTIWIPLTPATLENGCMHVVPRDRVSVSAVAGFGKRESFRWSETVELLQACRPLPAEPGSILGWDFDVVHWGGMCFEPQGRRIAISLEFAGPHVTPTPDEMPLLAVDGPLPDFSQRLQFIFRALRTYDRFEQFPPAFSALADAMLKAQPA